VRILVRADSGFAREELMAWCETNGVDFLFGLAKTDRLIAEIESELEQAAVKSERTGKPARCFKDFVWRTRSSWSRQRRVVAKAEWTQGESFKVRVERANSKTLNSVLTTPWVCGLSIQPPSKRAVEQIIYSVVAASANNYRPIHGPGSCCHCHSSDTRARNVSPHRGALWTTIPWAALRIAAGRKPVQR
jgi:hypothetical protein